MGWYVCFTNYAKWLYVCHALSKAVGLVQSMINFLWMKFMVYGLHHTLLWEKRVHTVRRDHRVSYQNGIHVRSNWQNSLSVFARTGNVFHLRRWCCVQVSFEENQLCRKKWAGQRASNYLSSHRVQVPFLKGSPDMWERFQHITSSDWGNIIKLNFRQVFKRVGKIKNQTSNCRGQVKFDNDSGKGCFTPFSSNNFRKKIFRKPSKNLGVGKNHLQSGLILDFIPQSEYIEDHAIKRQVVPHSRHSFLFLVAIPQVHEEVV